MTNISVIIPVLNEELSIGKVLDDIPREMKADVVVVDNGCTDRTVEIAASKGARVVTEPRPGYGSACWRGIEALDNPDIVVFLDGDYSDHPDEMTELVRPIRSGQADMVIGSRILGDRQPGALPIYSVFGNWLASKLLWLLYRQQATDLGPFRAISYPALMDLEMKDRGFGWTMEMQARAAARGYRTVEIPASYRKRIGKSKITGNLRNAFLAGWMITTTAFTVAASERISRRPKRIPSSER